MRRRHYLALFAAAGTAGCNTDEFDIPGGDTPTDTEEPTATGSPTDTETPTESPTDTETPTETERELSESERRAEDRLAEADDMLATALQRYAAAGDAESVLEVRASGGAFRSDRAVNSLTDLEDTLSEAREDGNRRQRDRADSLGRLGDFVRNAARTQSALGDAFVRFGNIHEAYVDEAFSRVNDNRDPFRSRTSTAADRLDDATAEATTADAEASDAVDRELFEAKVAQLRGEVTAFSRLAGELTAFTAGMRDWGDGVDQYVDNQRWSPAAAEFADATDGLEAVADRLDVDPVDDAAVDDRFADLRALALTLSEASPHMEASAEAYSHDDRSTARERLEDAKTRLDESALVRRDVDSAGKVLDYDPP